MVCLLQGSLGEPLRSSEMPGRLGYFIVGERKGRKKFQFDKFYTEWPPYYSEIS